jgi:hypothetical protein
MARRERGGGDSVARAEATVRRERGGGDVAARARREAAAG